MMNRGLARQSTFLDADCYSAFLDTLAEAHRRFSVQVHAYCLMGNHYHLLLHTPEGNLSRAMRHINGVYTQRFNRLQKRDGPLFRGRYKAIVVEADSYLLSLTRYIHRNPVETRTPLVASLQEYPWSSYPAYLNKARAPEWLYRDFTYEALGRRDKYRGYKAYVEQGVDEELAEFYGRQRKYSVLGSEVFRERLLGGDKLVSAEVASRELVVRPPVSGENLVEQVAQVFGCSPAEILARSRPGRKGYNPARSVAMWLCQDRAGLTLPQIARLFGGIHYSAVSQSVRRIKTRMAEDEELQSLVDRVSRGVIVRCNA
ncbi:helix-turn-helix domain-containing protein [Microbulbifer harenosus]|uniref:helix-turn-helix domain-containing protein n=1 Tax=Microbulbifer harenosus TaxID=2576840 RepID=UPI00148510BF|nr:transposase [Microbulbifer harenosus]